jgi:hypothetical protein
MIEIRGLSEYEAFSQGSGRSRKRGEEQGAEFNKLLHGGEERMVAGSVSNDRTPSDGAVQAVSEKGMFVYDGSGKQFLSLMHVGRNLDVAW